jgi:hypothetical protein
VLSVIVVTFSRGEGGRVSEKHNLLTNRPGQQFKGASYETVSATARSKHVHGGASRLQYRRASYTQ